MTSVWGVRQLSVGSGTFASLRNLDPYLIWTLKTRPNPFPVDGKSVFPGICVLVKFRKRDELGSEIGPNRDLTLFPTHFHSIRSPAQRTQWRSCVTNKKGLEVLMCSAANGGAGVERFELSEVRHGLANVELALKPARAVPFRGTSSAVIQLLQNKLDLSEQAAKAGSPVKLQGLAGSDAAAQPSANPMVCVIDDRCNFASVSLHWAGISVVESIWHQGSSKAELDHVDAANSAPDQILWKQPLHVNVQVTPINGVIIPGISIGGAIHGRVFEIGDLSAPSSASSRTSMPMAEPLAYKRVAYLYPTYRWSHGSAIMDLVAGREHWGTRRPGQWTEPRKWPRLIAPQKVRFVQLPSETVADTSGGSLGSHVLDGIHHALEEADPGQDVIVNISYGTHSGPHDGTSLFESALEELLDFYDGSGRAMGKTLHVVLPAGNSHLWRCHASGWLGRNQTDVRRLHWQVLPDNAAPSFIEIWLPIGSSVGISVTAPNGEKLVAAPTQGGGVWEFKSSDRPGSPVEAALIWPPSVPQGERRTMALLAVQASLPPAPVEVPFIAMIAEAPVEAPVTPPILPKGMHGTWEIELENLGSEAVLFDAWVQRADAAPGRGPQMRGFRGRQSYLLESKDCKAPDGDMDVDPRCTMNGIATLKHDRLYVIGAMRRSDGSISHYSAGGPNAGCDKRFDGPDWVVPADESFNNPGLLTTGVLSGSRQRVPGTSMAAAAFTRLLYEHLAAGHAADSLCGPTPDLPTRLPVVPCGSPDHADPMHRGECVRLMPTNNDGTLGLPCAPSFVPAQCKLPG